MMRPQRAPRATCRRANSAISRAGARASTANCRSWLAASTGRSARPNRSWVPGRKVLASQLLALLTRISTGPRAASARSKTRAGAAGSARSASLNSAAPPAALGVRGLARVPGGTQPQESQEHCHALGRERACCRRADPLVGPGDEGHPPVEPWVDHPLISWLRARARVTRSGEVGDIHRLQLL